MTQVGLIGLLLTKRPIGLQLIRLPLTKWLVRLQKWPHIRTSLDRFGTLQAIGINVSQVADFLTASRTASS